MIQEEEAMTLPRINLSLCKPGTVMGLPRRFGEFAASVFIIIIIIIFINCNWVITRWQWSFYVYTDMKKK